MNEFFAGRQKGKTTWLLAEAARQLTLTSGEIYLISGLGREATQQLHKQLIETMDLGANGQRRVNMLSRGDTFLTGVYDQAPLFIDEADSLSFRETMALMRHDRDCIWITAR